MKDFQFYITDDRYAVPSLLMVSVLDDEGAREAAERIVAEPHHLVVEVWEAGIRRFEVARTPANVARTSSASDQPSA